MEARRGNLQALPKQQSSKMQVVKTASEVSLTPSQAAEQAKLNERKNPLDALSRLSLRPQGVEKRSGLQDVDDEYFKKNMFSRTHLNRHAGLNDSYELQGHTISQAQGDASNTQQQQYQGKQPYNLNSTHAHHPTSLSAQPNQQTTEILSQQQVPSHQPQTTSAPMQCKNQFKEPHLSQLRTEARNQHPQQQQQQQPIQSSPVPAPEPELCTTCPNCQTTIYLVRGHDTSSEPAQGYTSNQHDTTGSTTAN
ncbi:transcription factor SPT20 homolog isoform X1 [Bactrocera tryoni]|uniref:transcription factor SPT20 homolog isoform X1 n=1 Tax=Bactrocera tryoni TaxID=59916 RepID=UPI001A98AF1C|nr:transcription factor SPT20 homolog isoform X1 [Bactrocera tryoni]